MKNSLFLAILLFSFIGLYAQKTLTPIDEGSKIHFVIKNLGINTGGDLTGLKGTIKIDVRNPAASAVNVTVDVKTIDTDNDRRDNHLRTADFFDVEKYPVISIKSTGIETTSTPGSYIFKGTLTIKNITKPISFPFTAVNSAAGFLFNGAFELNRLDYGIGKESATMSDNVKVELKVFAK